MNNHSGTTCFFVAASSFLAGIAMGLLLSPWNRKWITDRAAEIANRFDARRTEAYHRGIRQYSRLRENVRREIRRNVPDLYGATEYIDLDETDF